VQHASHDTCTALFKSTRPALAIAAPQAQVNITNTNSSKQTGSLLAMTVTGGISSVQICSADETAAAGTQAFPEDAQWQLEITMEDADGLELLTQPPVSIGWLRCSCRNKQRQQLQDCAVHVSAASMQ
jgi:hypothetical protein